MIKKNNPIWASLGRFLRVLVAILLSGVVAMYSGHEYYILLAPFLNAFFKWLRDAYQIDIKIL